MNQQKARIWALFNYNVNWISIERAEFRLFSSVGGGNRHQDSLGASEKTPETKAFGALFNYRQLSPGGGPTARHLVGRGVGRPCLQMWSSLCNRTSLACCTHRRRAFHSRPCGFVLAQLDREFEAAERLAAADIEAGAETDSYMYGIRRPLRASSTLQITIVTTLNPSPRKHRAEFVVSICPWIAKVVENCAPRTGVKRAYRDDHATALAYTAKDCVIIADLHAAANSLGRGKTLSHFLAFAVKAADSDLLAIHRVLD